MASEIKVNKITGKGATGGADAPLQFDGNVLTTATIANATITNAAISKINLSGTTPASPVAGDMYYDTADNIVKIYNGSAWLRLNNINVGLGGNITSYIDSGTTYRVHTFLSSGVFIVQEGLTVDYLVVAGGGGSCRYSGGGGGAGGFRTGTGLSVSATSYNIVVGGGGTAGGDAGGKGENSSFSSITSTGGGNSQRYVVGVYDGDGHTGGSGSGVVGNPPGTAFTGGVGNEGGHTPPEGNDGGDVDTNSARRGSGGGGAGAAGTDGRTSAAHGGLGEDEIMGLSAADSYTLLTNANVGHVSGGARYFAGGGGGGAEGLSGGDGGLGGGGAGGATGVDGTAGTENTGGGAGAGGDASSGAAGGSGIVIIRYAI